MSSLQEPDSNSGNAALRIDSADGFAVHYRAVYPRLTLIAAGVLGHPGDAEDVVQQAATIALEKIDDEAFDSPDQLTWWLAAIVRRCALNHRRKRIGRRTFAVDPVGLSQMQTADEPAPHPIHPESGELQPDQSSFDDRLLTALQTLSVDARCCLLLRTVQKLSYAEISGLLSIPAGTAMSHVHRSRKSLRAILQCEEASTSSEKATTQK